MHASRFPGHDTVFEEARIKGRATARSEDILRVLELRGIDVPEAARERITNCTDLDTLGTWLDRTLTVASTEELFQEA
ncbi:hypothetical protein [Streptomyces sp. GQFP]|uniref:hypothetical protein n=1 Tax=Streptomyces sp. GQFP TaxID=2907545 RepID=UPI001F18C9D9|nr:hypothetical protein [Streptomyces sp. GQFP]UIX33922.1 hypothetical protein LUX31_30155 [Streptomyces sp. GQFP]